MPAPRLIIVRQYDNVAACEICGIAVLPFASAHWVARCHSAMFLYRLCVFFPFDNEHRQSWISVEQFGKLERNQFYPFQVIDKTAVAIRTPLSKVFRAVSHGFIEQ